MTVPTLSGASPQQQQGTAAINAWGVWVQSAVYSNSSVTTNGSITGAWPNWCSSQSITSSSGTTSYAQVVWASWIGNSVVNCGFGQSAPRALYDHPITREKHDAQMVEKRAACLRRLKSEMAEDVRAHMRKKVTQRAELLLAQHLTEEQRRDREAKGFFLVETKSGRRYRIEKNGQAGNVKLVNPEGRDIARFCIHPAEAVPNADAHLAQKLMLLIDEETFIRTANVSYLEGIDKKTSKELDEIRGGRLSAEDGAFRRVRMPRAA